MDDLDSGRQRSRQEFRECLFPEEEGKDYGKEDFDLEIADSAGNNETAKNADIAEIPSKTKEYLNEKNAVDEECDKKLSMPVKKTSALLDVRYTSLRQPYDNYTSLTRTSWLSPPLRSGIPEFLL